jgi:glutamate-1-semialdehyde 2,1-aminomutase
MKQPAHRLTAEKPKRRSKPAGAAASVLVGGVNSPVRAFGHIGGEAVIVRRADGASVWDVRGRKYLDFIMGWGALLLGHNPPAVSRALQAAVRSGELFGLTHPQEQELASLIAGRIASIEQVRFTVSGTEAVMTAVRLARAHTGRRKILLFDGCYHGHSDALMASASSAGIPETWAESVIRVPYNDIAAVEAVLAREGERLACAVVEPVAANIGILPPEKGFLEALRRSTARAGVLLIFDEVVTGFRLCNGSAQQVYGVSADLTTLGKIIGGGMPIGALGGPRRLMQHLAPVGDVYHGGTFAGHPLSMAAGTAMLRNIRTRPPYRQLESLTARLVDGLRIQAASAGVGARINRVGSMMTVFFSDRPVRDKETASAASHEAFALWARTLQRQGILVAPSPFEAVFVSAAHTRAHIDAFLEAAKTAWKRVRTGSRA